MDADFTELMVGQLIFSHWRKVQEHAMSVE
jgi:hypothetical protein